MQEIYHCCWHEVVCSTFEATHIPCVTINTWEWMRRNKNVLHSTGAAHTYPDIPYSRKLLREKTFTNFEVFWGAWHPLTAQVSNPQMFSPQKSYFPPIRKGFLPWKFYAPGLEFYFIKYLSITDSFSDLFHTTVLSSKTSSLGVV